MIFVPVFCPPAHLPCSSMKSFALAMNVVACLCQIQTHVSSKRPPKGFWHPGWHLLLELFLCFYTEPLSRTVRLSGARSGRLECPAPPCERSRGRAWRSSTPPTRRHTGRTGGRSRVASGVGIDSVRWMKQTRAVPHHSAWHRNQSGFNSIRFAAQ